MPPNKKKTKPAVATPATAAPNGRRRRQLALAAVAVILCCAVAVYWRINADIVVALLPPPQDPRLTNTSPYLNVRPEVKYVGDEACARCHRAISNSYHLHPMGRSLEPVAKAVPMERFGAEAHDPFEAQGFLYGVAARDGRVYHSESVSGSYKSESEITYTVGSGRSGRSYLIDRDGYLYMSPISWYPRKGIWDLSPGYDPNNMHFSRPVVPACLFCHCNQAEPDRHAANRYVPPLFRGAAVGCERCHGPGSLHVERRRAGAVEETDDFTIVNPRRLEPELREGVCQQCHLQSESRVTARGRSQFDYRPGLPLSSFLADFVRPPDQPQQNKFVGTVEQMYSSRCFQKSVGADKLGCISCHDPHVLPAQAERNGYYRDRCMKCHTDTSCSLPKPQRLLKSSDDSCIQCHMPTRGSDIPHTVITDHTIPRREQEAAPEKESWPRPGQMPLVAFPPNGADLHDPNHARNLGVALIGSARKHQPSSRAAAQMAEAALPLLKLALAGDPHDLAAGEALVTALMYLNSAEDALAICTELLKEDAQSETLLFMAAVLTKKMQQPALATLYARRAIEANPWHWQYHNMLAVALAQQADWSAAADACRAALKLEPANLPCRQLLIRCYLQRGDKERARAELETCLPLVPANEREAFRVSIQRQLP
jgi:Tetratricopeptide repeat